MTGLARHCRWNGSAALREPNSVFESRALSQKTADQQEHRSCNTVFKAANRGVDAEVYQTCAS
jgi:hypothetical protein